MQQGCVLFGHLVGACKYREPKRLCWLQVDDQVILGWYLHRQVGWVSPLQNLINVTRSAPEQVEQIRPIREKPTTRSGSLPRASAPVTGRAHPLALNLVSKDGKDSLTQGHPKAAGEHPEDAAKGIDRDAISERFWR